MLSLLHRTSLFYSRLSRSVSVPVKHQIAQPLDSGIRRTHGRVSRTHYFTRAALKRTGSGSAKASMGYWLVKTEPGEWSWEHQEQNGGISHWDGVRNAQAQIHLRTMRQGDHAFFYHSGKRPAVIGLVEILRAAYPDPSDNTGKSSMVDLRALAAFPNPVPLSVVKSEGSMRDWILLRQSRLSVMPVPPDVWRRVCELGELSSPPPCRTSTPENDEDDDAVAETKPAEEPEGRIAQPKRRRRGEGNKAGAQTKITKQKSSRSQAAILLLQGTANNHEEQSTQSEVVSVAELKTYQRSSRKRLATVEPSIVKTYKSRRVKKLPGDETPH